MDEATKRHRERFAKVALALAEEPGVTVGRPGKTFGQSALKINDKIFAMVSSAGQFVVKLPKARVDDLEAGRAGKRFEASRGRPMKEWLQLDSGSALEWLELTREALSFVRSLP